MRRPAPLAVAEAQGLYATLAQPQSLLAFDFDGTLAPLVDDRERAFMRTETAQLFVQLCERYPTLVISGRARPDVQARLGLARPAAIIGNHGAEDGQTLPKEHHALMRHAVRALREVAGEWGLDVEDKGVSLSVHLPRHAPREWSTGIARVREALTELREQVRIMPGHAVVNITPAAADHKGTALQREARAHRAARVLFVGDDVTDEDVFRTDIPGLIGVHIGDDETSAADYFMASQHDIDRLLRALLAARVPS